MLPSFAFLICSAAMARDQDTTRQQGRDSVSYGLRFAQDRTDLLACQRLRQRCFFGSEGVDCDVFDDACDHLMICDATDQVVCTVRLRVSAADKIGDGYAGHFYDLTALSKFPSAVMEIGRMCVDPLAVDPQILRMVWAALTAITDRHHVGLIFGCSSFDGTAAAPHATSLQRLHDRYLAPDHYGSFRKSAHFISCAGQPAASASQMPMPPLLRSYLAMGGWVSDHAVVDHQMETLHVLTGIEIANIPAQRAKVLRDLATEGDFTLDCDHRTPVVG